MAKYHNYEIASAALEIGIVLASATIITGMAVLAWIAGGLGIIGLGFIGIAYVCSACGAFVLTEQRALMWADSQI